MTITEAFDAYRSDIIVFKNQSPKTEENHNIVQRALVAYFGDISIESLQFAMVRDWKISLDSQRQPETVRNYIIKLRVVLGYLQHRGFEVLDPENIPVPQRGDKVPAFITKEEVAQLIDCAFRLQSKCIISLLYSSGIRLNELINLNISDIHGDSFTVVGKGNKARLCFIDARTKALLKMYLSKRNDNHPALFISQFGHRLSATNVQLVLKNATQKAGIARCTPHTLRHSFATNLLQSNTNLFYVQQMMGHKSLQTTQQYLHVVNEDLRNVYLLNHTV